MNLKEYFKWLKDRAVSLETSYTTESIINEFRKNYLKFKQFLNKTEKSRYIRDIQYINECLRMATIKWDKREYKKAGSPKAADLAFYEVELERLKED